MKMKIRVLAVLVLALFIINLAPVRRADASEVSSYYAAYVKACDYVGVKPDDYTTFPYRLVHNAGASFSYITVLFNDQPFYWQNDYNDAEYPYGFKPACIIHVYKDGSIENRSGWGNIITGFDDIIWSNQDAFYNGTVIHVGDGDFVPDPIVLPVTEEDYTYWLYHKTASGEYMYWSKEVFDLETYNDGYLLTLSTGDVMYRLHLDSSHKYYRQVLTAPVQYVISSGDVLRSGHKLVYDDFTIDAWLEGDVTSEEIVKQYSIPHITKFLSRIRSARTPLEDVVQGSKFFIFNDDKYIYGTREYAMSIDIELSGDFDAAVTEQKVLIDGNYILPSEEYFRFCDSENIEPSQSHFMNFVKNKQEEYYILVDWSHIESIVNLPGLTSDYGFRLTYSKAVDALIERGEFTSLYSKSVLATYIDEIERMCCPYRLACTLIGVVDGEYYYGDTYITVLYSELDDTTEDVSGVYSDYVSLDNEQRTDAIESTINEAQDDKLQEYIDKKDAELDALIEEYEMKLAALDTSSSFGGTGDMFRTFSNIANGMVGLSGSFRKIAVAVGNVFAFFPEEITGLLFAGIVAMIVIAVYKALRG